MAGDYLPTATFDMLRRRAELLKQVRQFFDSRDFLEVETPLLSHDVVVDRHLDPLSVTLFADPREPQRGERLWLQTSPEFAMKRLLAAYAVASAHPLPALAIFQVTRAFRGGEVGQFHNPEFTMVEWYRVWDDFEAGMDLLSDLTEAVLARGRPELLSFAEAFIRHADVYPMDLPEAQLDVLLATKVEPHLGKDRPTILYGYPSCKSGLARILESDPPVAERFELYVDGIELANGYHELLNPAHLRSLNQYRNEARATDGKYTLPEESRLLAAMDHGLPACSGCALGFDRLVMVATGAKSIQEVLAFPIDRA